VVDELKPRHATALVAEALADTRVVLVNGARQAGKSTLTRLAAADRADTVTRLLDDPATLRAPRTTQQASWTTTVSWSSTRSSWSRSCCARSR
jgi:hypothetical protein